MRNFAGGGCKQRAWGIPRSRRVLLEQERGEGGEVAPPDHPGMLARGLDIGVLNSLGPKPVTELAVCLDEMVVRAASDPKQSQLRVNFGVEGWELDIELLGKSTRAESADPGEVVQSVQSGQEGLGAAH